MPARRIIIIGVVSYLSIGLLYSLIVLSCNDIALSSGFHTARQIVLRGLEIAGWPLWLMLDLADGSACFLP